MDGDNHIGSQSGGTIPTLRCLKRIKRGDVKRFREHLNAQDTGDSKHREGRFRQKSRKYGDYLYSQDRERFDAEMIEWLPTQERKALKYTIIGEYLDVSQFWCEVHEGTTPEEACAAAFNSCAEANGWEIQPSDTFRENDWGWRLVVCFEGDIAPEKLLLWGDAL